MKNTHSDALRLFNEKADKLSQLGFTRRMLGNNIQVEISGERGKPIEIIRNGPNQEEIDAFVLTFRFFYQDNERSSLRNLAEIYNGLSVSDELKHEFVEARKAINEFLDNPPPITIKFLGEKLTRRKILEVFIYGGLAHANPEKKIIYDKWMLMPPLGNILLNEFCVILAQVLSVINFITELNRHAIEEIERLSTQ